MKITTILSNNIQATQSKKINKYIEIVGSTNGRLNAMSWRSRLSVLAVLSEHYTKVAITIVDNMADLEKLVAKKPDLVVLGMKLILLDPSKGYDDSPKVWLPDYLEENNISYTGSETDALLTGYNKNMTKQRVMDAGLKSSPFFISTVKQPSFDHNLSFPLFVKPLNRGGSKGIDEHSVVTSETDLKSKILSIHNDNGSDAIIEEYLPGREFSVAVLEQLESDELLAMPIEIITPRDQRGNNFLSETIKKTDVEQVAAVADAPLKDAVNSLAMGAFRALGSRDYGRIDIRLDSNGLPSFIEANLMPGLSDHGYLARCFYLNHQISYSDMILAIVALGLMRSYSAYQPAIPEDPVEILANELAITLPTL
jgi:D-alanine-D-alanine ligase